MNDDAISSPRLPSSVWAWVTLITLGCSGAPGLEPVDDGGAEPAPDGALVLPADDAGLAPDGSAPSHDAGAPLPIDASVPPPGPVAVVLPVEGAEVLFSIPIRVMTSPDAVRVEVVVTGHGDHRCETTAPDHECLLDVTDLPAGALELVATAFRADGSTVGSTPRSVVRRDVGDPCAGRSTDAIACIASRVEDGLSGGFEGVTYYDYDNRHAVARTSDMVGIDVRVRDEVTSPDPDAVLGVGNQSRACAASGMTQSIPRCVASVLAGTPLGVRHYENNFLVFWPEHRDHGHRDYYQWQAPYYELSQGSSGSELDEVRKALLALGVMSPDARAALVEAHAVAPTLRYLIRRARVATDAAYFEPEAHVTALRDSDDLEAVLRLASALRVGELPPIVRVRRTDLDTPPEWGMVSALSVPYGIGFAPNRTPTTTDHAGRFRIEVSLDETVDPASRPLTYFARVVRGDASDVVVTRLDDAGTRWSIETPHPVDSLVTTGGHERTSSRVTVAFIAHNGLWPSTPAYVSVGGRRSGDPAPNENDLD